MPPRQGLVGPKLGPPPDFFGIMGDGDDSSDEGSVYDLLDIDIDGSTSGIIWNLLNLGAAFLIQVIVLLGSLGYVLIVREMPWTCLVLMSLAIFQGVLFGEGLRRSFEFNHYMVLLRIRRGNRRFWWF